MSQSKIHAGQTNAMRPIFVRDNSKTDGSGLGSLVYNTSGLAAKYRREGDNNWTAITLATATLGTYASGGFVADSGPVTGGYEVGLPAGATASGAKWVIVVYYGAANMLPTWLFVELDAADYQDGAALGLSRLDANVGSRSTYSGGAADADATSILADAAAIETQTNKIGTNSADSPNEVTAQGNAATAATEATAAAGSAASAASSAATAASQATTAATDAAAIETQTNKIGTNSGDSPNVQAEQSTVSTDLDAKVSSRSTYAGGTADADAATILSDLAAVESQTNKIGTNAGDSPNEQTAQGNAATAASEATAAAGSAASAATSAATAASQATTAATQATSAAATIGALATLLDAMISGGSFTSDALKNAPTGSGGSGTPPSVAITPLQAVVAGGAILGEDITAYVGYTMPVLEFDLVDQLGNAYTPIGPVKFRLYTLVPTNPGSESTIDTITATLVGSKAYVQVPSTDNATVEILGFCLFDAGINLGTAKMPVKLGHYKILSAGPAN